MRSEKEFPDVFVAFSGLERVRDGIGDKFGALVSYAATFACGLTIAFQYRSSHHSRRCFMLLHFQLADDSRHALLYTLFPRTYFLLI